MASFFEAAAALTNTAAAFVSEAQNVLEREKNEFLAEYSRCSAGAAASSTAASTKAAEKPEAVDQLKRVGAALFSPFDDQDSIAATASKQPDRVIMLPWEQPGLSEGVRSRMRALSQVTHAPARATAPRRSPRPAAPPSHASRPPPSCRSAPSSSPRPPAAARPSASTCRRRCRW